MFKRGLSLAVCLAAIVGMECDGARGMDEGTVSISDIRQFIEIGNPQAAKIKELCCNSISVDETFCKHWVELRPSLRLAACSFKHCFFSDDSFVVFDGLDVVHLSVINSRITTEQAGWILSGINPYLIRSVVLTGNCIAIRSSEWAAIYASNVANSRMDLLSFDLRDNRP